VKDKQNIFAVLAVLAVLLGNWDGFTVGKHPRFGCSRVSFICTTVTLTVFIGIVSVLIGMASTSSADNYDRKDFNYRSYKLDTTIGFYTGKTCDSINIDHILSLKDAYESGARK
jgi:hypothetical protein